MILGLPFGTWLGRLLIDASSTDAYSIPYVVEFKSYVVTIILTLVFTVITNMILSRRIKAIDMLEVLKNKE